MNLIGKIDSFPELGNTIVIGGKIYVKKQEPLSEKEIEEHINSLRSSTVSEEYYSEEWEEGFEDGVRWAEKQLENKQ